MSEENTANKSKQDYIDNPNSFDVDMFTNDMYPKIGAKKSEGGCLKGCLVFFCMLVAGFLFVLLVLLISERIRDRKQERQGAKDKEIAKESLEWSLKQYYGLDKGDYAWDGEFVKMYSGYRCNFVVNGQIYSAEYHSSDWKETDYLVAKFQDGLREQLLQNIRESNLFPGHVKENVTFTFNKLPTWVTETEIADFFAGNTNRMDKWKEIETNLGIEFFSNDETVYGVMPSAATFYDALKLGDIGFNVKELTVSCSVWPIPTDGNTGLVAWRSFQLPDDVTKAREMMAEQEPIRHQFRNSFTRMMREDYGIDRGDLEIVDITLSESMTYAKVQFCYKDKTYDAYSVGESIESPSGWWTNLYYDSFIKAAREYLYHKAVASGMFPDYNGIAVSARSSKVLKGFGERKVLPSWIGEEEIKDCFRSASDQLKWKELTVRYEIDIYVAGESDLTDNWKRYVPNTADACCTLEMSNLNGYVGTPNKATLLGSSAYIADRTNKPVSYNFEGTEITILDWWSDENWRKAQNQYEEIFLDEFTDSEELYHFTLNRKNIVADTGNSYLETLTLSIVNNVPEGQIITLKSREIATLLRSGLLADVKTASVNWDDEKWNAQVKQIMTINGGLYGFAPNNNYISVGSGSYSAGIGVVFDPKVFHTLNISTSLPYDLQKEGKWNWEEFTRLCGRLTCDTNNDDQTDIYALSVKAGTLAEAALLSNDASIITKERDTGLLVKYENNPAALAALNFVETLYKNGYIVPEPNPADDYKWPQTAFRKGNVAMYIAEEEEAYEVLQISMMFGFVSFPYGPDAGRARSLQSPHIMAVPSCSSIAKDIPAAIAAYDIYTTAPLMYGGDSIWMGPYDRKYLDERIITETLRIMLVDGQKRMNPAILIPDYDYDTWAEELMNGKDLETVMNTWSPKWNEQIEDFNVKFK